MTNNNEFMPFGSVMNNLQGQIPFDENWEKNMDRIIAWCKKQTFEPPFPDKHEWKAPVGVKPCPVCSKPMVQQLDKKNAKAPDWKCSDSACKYQWDKVTKTYIKSDYITGVWN